MKFHDSFELKNMQSLLFSVKYRLIVHRENNFYECYVEGVYLIPAPSAFSFNIDESRAIMTEKRERDKRILYAFQSQPEFFKSPTELHLRLEKHAQQCDQHSTSDRIHAKLSNSELSALWNIKTDVFRLILKFSSASFRWTRERKIDEST